MSSSKLSSRGTSRSVASVLKVMGIAILVIGLVLVFTGCGDKAGLVGKWTSAAQEENIEFTTDGKMIVTNLDGSEPMELTYKAEGSKLTVGIMGMESTVDFTLSGDKLTVNDPETGDPVDYTRVK